MLSEGGAYSKSIPAPIGGWNARDSVDLMKPQDAVRLVNVIPGAGSCRIRPGFTSHATGIGSSSPVQTLATFNGQDGTIRLVAAGGGKVYNATSSGAATQLATGFTSNRWQTTNFRNRLIMVNGADTPQKYDGTNLTAATYTGIADPTKLVYAFTFKSRLYFLEVGTQNLWYGATNTIEGALTAFDLGGVVALGGYPVALGSWSNLIDGTRTEVLIIVFSTGEVVAYAGSDPATTWTIAAHFFLPRPFGYRCIFQTGQDTAIITEEGAIPLSSVSFQADAEGTTYQRLDDKIKNAFTSAAQFYGGNTGWQGIVYPKGQICIVNIPLGTDTSAEQYVFNTLTGAWCRFTGVNALCWCVSNRDLYFGGADGKVYKFDSGLNDNGASIAVDIKTAFNYFGDRQFEKLFTLVRPKISGDISTNFVMNVDTDGSERMISDTISVTGTPGEDWDVATWDTAAWDTSDVSSENWYTVNGLGRSAAIRMSASLKNINFELKSFDIVYQRGGVFG